MYFLAAVVSLNSGLGSGSAGYSGARRSGSAFEPIFLMEIFVAKSLI
jgi:hypothetical protein